MLRPGWRKGKGRKRIQGSFDRTAFVHGNSGRMLWAAFFQICTFPLPVHDILCGLIFRSRLGIVLRDRKIEFRVHEPYTVVREYSATNVNVMYWQPQLYAI